MGRRLLEAVGAAASMEANCECDSGDFMGDPSRPVARWAARLPSGSSSSIPLCTDGGNNFLFNFPPLPNLKIILAISPASPPGFSLEVGLARDPSGLPRECAEQAAFRHESLLRSIL